MWRFPEAPGRALLVFGVFDGRLCIGGV